MSLYGEIGGRATLDEAVDRFYMKVLADPSLAPFFASTNMRRQRAMQKGFLAMVLGGPVAYTGRDMREAHAHLVVQGLNESHVDGVANHLADTLLELGFSEEMVRQVREVFYSWKDEVLAGPLEGSKVEERADPEQGAVSPVATGVQDILVPVGGSEIFGRAVDDFIEQVSRSATLSRFFATSPRRKIREMFLQLVESTFSETTENIDRMLTQVHADLVKRGLGREEYDEAAALIRESFGRCGVPVDALEQMDEVVRQSASAVLGVSDETDHQGVVWTSRAVGSITEYLEVVQSFSGLVLFRGHADERHWKLVPTIARLANSPSRLNLGRLGGWLPLEFYILERFRRHAIPYLKSIPETTIDWLVLGQHYGLPTRLLDWTENPLVALFFALRETLSGLSVVWAIEPRYVFSSDLDLNELDKIQVYFPKSIDQRIVSQKGCFTIQPFPPLCEPFVPIESDGAILDEGVRSLTRIVIEDDLELKRNLMLELHRLGVDNNFIFPDLEGLGHQVAFELMNDISRP